MDGNDRGTVISPEVVTTTWDETYAMRIHVTAGRPYVAGDDEVVRSVGSDPHGWRENNAGFHGCRRTDRPSGPRRPE